VVEKGKYCFFGISSREGALGKNKGCENAPLYLANLFSVKANEFILSKNDVELQQKEIFEQSKKVLSACADQKTVFFGGTHDITFSLFKAFAEQNKNASLLIFDAHSDCDEGLSTPSHEDFVRALIEQKIVFPQNVMLFGLRKIYPSEKEFLKTSGVKQIYLKDLKKNPLVSNKVLKEFVKNSTNLYVSFDVDVIDSKIMKATGYIHKGGLSVSLVKKYLSFALGSAKVLDIVEFNSLKAKPIQDKAMKDIFRNFL